MHRCASGFARCQKAWHNLVRLIPDALRLPICRDAAHVVVHGWQYRSRLLCDIDTSEDLCGLRDSWETLGKRLWWQMIQMQVDVVAVRADSTALANLQGHCTAHDVA